MTRAKKIDHVSFAVPELEAATAFFRRFLPIQEGPTRVWGTDVNRFTGRTLHLEGSNVELLEPVESDGFVARFLASRGPGVHHVTIQVEDLAEAKQQLDSMGVPWFGQGAEEGAIFVHPRHAFGVLLQLIPVKE